ncbi:hypothetical protein WICMUC_002815 [Wickerhamomyces mucosus]|uniref:Uncharacterized protein n=1 Tax=Wickerhamomyces mucosus TaxID=1378264 RepID=A0A9P8PPH6_9ASCO|nr:hypothetical protein WICMUC_002815 [Wickerhamomyces mucosus]
MTNAVAANVLGTIATVCWCIQLVPQIIHNFRRKNCEGLQPLMLFLWSASGIPFSIYFVSRRSTIPIQIQPQMFTSLCLVTWFQSLYYPPVQTSKKRAWAYCVTFVIIGIALEVGFIIPLKKAYDKGIMWPSLIFGVIASVLLAVGLIPPYFELSKRKGEVVGINFLFLTLDFSGALLSMISLAFTDDFDIMGCILYAIVGSMELGIFVSHFIWWLRIGRNKSKESKGSKEGELKDEKVHATNSIDLGNSESFVKTDEVDMITKELEV